MIPAEDSHGNRTNGRPGGRGPVRGYVINLSRSADRRAHILAELRRVNASYDLVPAVDGRELDLADPGMVDPTLVGTSWFRPGVAGCALSHLATYRKMLADGADNALVLEDDVELPDDLTRLADEIAEHMLGAEVVLLNYDSANRCRLSTSGLVQLRSGRQLALPLDADQPSSGACYLISSEACRRLAQTLLPVRAKADEWGRFFRGGLIDRLRCVVPLPVLKSPAFASTMAYNSPESVKGRVLAAATKHQITPVLSVIAGRRRRTMRRWTRFELTDAPFIERPSRLD